MLNPRAISIDDWLGMTRCQKVLEGTGTVCGGGLVQRTLPDSDVRAHRCLLCGEVTSIEEQLLHLNKHGQEHLAWLRERYTAAQQGTDTHLYEENLTSVSRMLPIIHPFNRGMRMYMGPLHELSWSVFFVASGLLC